jgi:hypothetical protein
MRCAAGFAREAHNGCGWPLTLSRAERPVPRARPSDVVSVNGPTGPCPVFIYSRSIKRPVPVPCQAQATRSAGPYYEL